jgi:hypothetical protein
VQARDLNNGQKDTNNTGNTVAKYNAPTAPGVTNAPVFALENFETTGANSRFTPPLMDAATPDQGMPVFQRVPNAALASSITSSAMYAPDFDPGSDGAPSDFFTTIGPITLTATSVLEFDHKFAAEDTFDGGVIEIKVGGDATFIANPYPDNVTTFDLGNYIVEGPYNGALNGTLAANVILSPLQGRRAYTGSKGLHHVRIPLRAFAAGGVNNVAGLPVRIRFRMTSDAGSSAGKLSGWYIDNLVINDLDTGSCTALAVSRKTHAPNLDFDVRLPLTGPAGVECRDPGTNKTHQLVVTFFNPVTVNGGNQPQATINAPKGGSIDSVTVSNNVVVVNLKDVTDAQTLSVTLNNVANGTTVQNVTIPVTVVAGDTNGDTRVNIEDTNQTKSNAGSLATDSTFRTDVNLDGRINIADTNFVKNHSGSSVSSEPARPRISERK